MRELRYISMGKTALVTGGAVRLGSHIVLHLAQQGWDIALHYHSSCDEASKMRGRVQALGSSCEVFFADLSKRQNFSLLFEKICALLATPSLLVNNASVYEAALLYESSWEMWERHFAVNARAPFFLMQAFAKIHKSRLGKEGSSAGAAGQANVINILDNKIAFAQYHYSAYLLSKKLLRELSIMAAAELAPQIRVNAIAPGVILAMPSRTQEYLAWRREGIALKKQGGPQNILQAIDYILGNDFVTGQILTVDGGESLAFPGRNFASYRS